MKLKSLLPMAIVLIVLVGLVALRKSQVQELTLTEEVRLNSMLPEDFDPATLGTLELYAGGAPDTKVILTRTAPPDPWRVTTHYDAPVKSKKIDSFIDTLMELEGEFRARVEEEDGRATYDLTDEAAFHITGTAIGSETPAFHLLVGKIPAYGSVFVRDSESSDIYVGNANLRQDVGLYTPNRATPPKADIWLDKQVIALARNDIQSIALTMPDKSLVLEKREVEPPEPEEGETPAPVEYEWVVASGGVGTLNQASVTSLLGKLAGLNATTIVDPSQKEKWGMDAPTYSCAVTLAGAEEPVLLEAARTKPGAQGYLRVAGREPEMLYAINRFDFKQMFPAGTDLFELTGTDFDAETIDRVEMLSPDGRITLKRSKDGWIVKEPKTGLAVEQSAIESAIASIAHWTPEDYADTSEHTGLDAPERTLTIGRTDGDDIVIRVGAPSMHIDGRYAKVSGNEQTLAISTSDLDRMFLEAKDIFVHGIFDIDEDAITHIEITKGEDTYSMDRTESGWTIHEDGEDFEGDPNRIEDYTFALAIFEAEDFAFGDVATAQAPTGSVSFTMDDGTKHAFTVGPEHEGQYRVTVRGRKGVSFLVNAAEANRVLADVATLKATPEEIPESTDAVVETTL
ncbi:MAG: DUF4340 domain-containing protein [Candidatus Hydrogenedentes bacterium]|nr:DUF4340 domain-containing protein [Candidatus Hydrogenedentota bacterium]